MCIRDDCYRVKFVVDFNSEGTPPEWCFVAKVDTLLAGCNYFGGQKAVLVKKSFCQFETNSTAILRWFGDAFVMPALGNSRVVNSTLKIVDWLNMLAVAIAKRGRGNFGYRPVVVGDDKYFALGDTAEVGREVFLNLAKADCDHIGIVPCDRQIGNLAAARRKETFNQLLYRTQSRCASRWRRSAGIVLLSNIICGSSAMNRSDAS